VRAVIDTARQERRRGGPPTVLFIDEVHRFSKTQQDSLLAAVEDRTVTLLAATTENPYFSIISPLLSRCVLLTLQALGDDDVRKLVRRALTDPRGLGGAVTLSDEAEDHLVRLASGDVRKALTALEAAASTALAQGTPLIDLATAEKAVDVAAVRYDRDGDAHYDVISAFIKSMRGSDPDAALHWLARMLVAGEDPRFIARRIVIFASEDVGMADPQALVVASAAAQAVQLIGLPECQLNLAQAVVHMATAPKSNAVTTALGAAMADVRAGRGGAVPAHLRDAHYPGARGLGHGRGYKYPHDDQRGVVTQQYIPDDLTEAEYYRPTDHGAERAVSERVPRLRRIVRGLAAPARPPASEGSAAPAGPATPDRAAGGGSAADASRSSVSTEPKPPPAAPLGREVGPQPAVSTGQPSSDRSMVVDERPAPSSVTPSPSPSPASPVTVGEVSSPASPASSPASPASSAVAGEVSSPASPAVAGEVSSPSASAGRKASRSRAAASRKASPSAVAGKDEPSATPPAGVGKEAADEAVGRPDDSGDAAGEEQP
jgi:putative ATPase